MKRHAKKRGAAQTPSGSTADARPASAARVGPGQGASAKRAELEQHRDGSRMRLRLALAALVLGLATLLWGWSRLLVVVANAKAEGRTSNAIDLGTHDPLGLALFLAGLLAAFVSTLLCALSFLHARHVERALAELDGGAADSAIR